MSSKHPPLVRTRLSIMMFLEFFVWGGWGIAITGYAQSLGFPGWQIGLLGSIPAIGAIISPLFVGLIADRFFPAQRVLAALHFLGGVCLIAAGFQTKFELLLLFMLLNGAFFMPTIALVNSVGFQHIPDPDKFPRIAVLGTIGWIMALLVASVLLGGMTTPNFLYQSGIAGIIMALYCLTLPHTPPKGAEAGKDVFGLSALRLLKDPSFLIFVTCVFLVSIPACGYFFTLQAPMLQQRGYPVPLALSTLNQISEIVFMFSMPLFVAWLGLKRVIMIGMTAWAVRYLLFTRPEFGIAVVALLLHGFCYSFFYVGSYMYIDRRAPAELKSSAQSLLTFLLIGVGWLIGGNAAGYMMEVNPAAIPNMGAVLGTEDPRPLPKWVDPTVAQSAWRYLDLSDTVKSLIYGEEKKPKPPDFAAQVDLDKDGSITLAELKKAVPPEGIVVGGSKYSKEELILLFKRVAKELGKDGVPEDQITLTRKDWLAVQSCNWKPIWLYPAIFIFVFIVVFGLAFREKPRLSEEEAGKESAQGAEGSEGA